MDYEKDMKRLYNKISMQHDIETIEEFFRMNRVEQKNKINLTTSVRTGNGIMKTCGFLVEGERTDDKQAEKLAYVTSYCLRDSD